MTHADVISLEDERTARSPHIEGEAHCLGCGHKWRAVVASEPYQKRLADLDPWLECPQCHCSKGLFTFQMLRPVDHWVCNCGNMYFALSRTGAYCPSCGAWQSWDPQSPLRPVG